MNGGLKKNYFFKNLSLIMLMILSLNINIKAQYCNGFSEKNCKLPIDWNYEISSQSVGIEMYQGQVYRIYAVLYSDNEYSIRFCPDNELGKIQYRLLSEGVELAKRTFDSGFESELSHIEFVNTITRRILIEVKVQKTSLNIDRDNVKCLGITIGSTKEYSIN